MRLSSSIRQQVAARADGRCEYCRCPSAYSADDYSVDHIRPRARAGASSVDNLAWACQGCNSRKYTATRATDPATGLRTALFHPRRQQWTRHFRWSDDGLHVIGLTPTGRATAARLQLSRPNVVNLRRALVIMGEHPPVD